MTIHLVQRRWSWVDDGVLPYMLALMRGLWVWVLLHVWMQGMFGGMEPDLLPPGVVFGLLAGGTAAAEIGAYVLRRRGPAMVLVSLSGLVALVGAYYVRFGVEVGAGPSDAGWLAHAAGHPGLALLLLPLATWLWWWGIMAGREPPFYDTYQHNFLLGLAALVVAGGAAQAAGAVPLRGVLLTTLLFFGVGLASLAVSGLQDTRRFERGRSEGSAGFTRYWLGTVAAVILALIAAGVLLAQLFAPEAVSRLLAMLGVVADLAARVLLLILMALAYVIFGALGLLASVFGLKPNTLQIPPLQVPDMGAQLQEMQQGQAPAIAPGLYLALRIGGGLLVLAAVALLFALAYRRLGGPEQEEVDESRESILTTELLKQQLAAWLRRRRPAASAAAPFVPVSGEDATGRVRRTYQALLAWAAAEGAPRPPGATPGEYATLLAGRLGVSFEAVRGLTELYLQARYGAEALPGAAAERAEAAWEAIRGQAGAGS